MRIDTFRAKLLKIKELAEAVANPSCDMSRGANIQFIIDIVQELDQEMEKIKQFMYNYNKEGNA